MDGEYRADRPLTEAARLVNVRYLAITCERSTR